MKRSTSRWDVIVAGCLAGVAALTGSSQAEPVSFTVTLEGAQQVPPVETTGIGTANLTYDPGRQLITWSLTYDGLSGPAMMAHIHGPAAEGRNGPPVIWLSEKSATVSNPIEGQATLTAGQAQQLMAGEWYINVHTRANPNGEIRGQVIPPKN